MAASDEEDSEFERFLQASLSSSSASSRSVRNSQGTSLRLPAVPEREGEEEERNSQGTSQRLPAVPEREGEEGEEEEREGLKWLKPHHGEGGGGGREGGGEAIKLEVAIPTPAPLRGEEGGGSESVTYSSDFSRDSFESSSNSTPVHRPESAAKSTDDFQDTFSGPSGSCDSVQVDQLHHSSALHHSGLSSIVEHTAMRKESSESESETERDEVTPTPTALPSSDPFPSNTNPSLHSVPTMSTSLNEAAPVINPSPPAISSTSELREGEKGERVRNSPSLPLIPTSEPQPKAETSSRDVSMTTHPEKERSSERLSVSLPQATSELVYAGTTTPPLKVEKKSATDREMSGLGGGIKGKSLTAATEPEKVERSEDKATPPLPQTIIGTATPPPAAGEWCEVVLEEAGEGLEREMYELQAALEVAGLPGIAKREKMTQPEPSNGARVSTATDSSPNLITPSEPEMKSLQLSDRARIGDPQNRVGGERERCASPTQKPAAVGEADTLRALAKEELSCLTRELLFERERRHRESNRLQTERGGKGGVVMGRGIRESGQVGIKKKTGLATVGTVGGGSRKKPETTSQKTSLTAGQTHSLKGSKTSLTSSKLGRPVGGSGSLSRLDSGAGRKAGRGGTKGGVRETETLRTEVDSLHQALSEEKLKTVALERELEERDRQHRAREEVMEASHLQREKALQEKVTQLSHSIELKGSPRQRVKVGGAISEREWEELRSSVREQETIISGYQKENERLYSQASEAQSSLRSAREQLSTDTQRLRTELANTKVQLEELRLRNKTTDSADDKTTSSKSDDVVRITQLEDQLERSQDCCRGLQRQVAQLKHSLSQQSSRPPGEGKKGEEGEGEGEREREREILKEKEREISELREKLLAAQRREKAVRKKTSSSSGEMQRVQQLERQVRGLNDIIKRRFPNSLSALIIATNSSSSRGENPAPAERDVGMEERVREMEAELGRREREARERVAALEQRHSAVEVGYQQRIASLERDLEESRQRGAGPGSCGVDERENGAGAGKRGGGKEDGGREVEEIEREKEKQEKRNEDLVRENEALRKQLSGAKLGTAHERLQLQSKLAEAEAATRAIREETTATVASLKQSHMDEVDLLRAQLARQQSQSENSSLRSQISALQIELHLMSQKLETAEEEREVMEEARERERELAQQIKDLSEQLAEAKKYQTPEMHHFSSLLAKISSLENRVSSSELAARQRAERLSQPLSHQLGQVERKWRYVVQAKDAEIAQFRAEMDTILQTLHALQTNHPSSVH